MSRPVPFDCLERQPESGRLVRRRDDGKGNSAARLQGTRHLRERTLGVLKVRYPEAGTHRAEAFVRKGQILGIADVEPDSWKDASCRFYYRDREIFRRT